MTHLHFLPDGPRARQLDVDVHAALHESLVHIAAQCREPMPDIAARLDAPIAILEAGQKLPPAAFGLYFDLAAALLMDTPEEADWPSRQLAGIAPRTRDLRLSARGDADVALLDAVLNRRMPDASNRFLPVDAQTRTDFAALIGQGLDLLARGAPALHAEITGILSQMLFATDPPGAEMTFDGASHYQFWGMLMLNPRHHKTPLAVAEVLAHECGHSLLFGMTITEPLTLNEDEERFASPLRPDPRPMDGIYHATFVSARMAWVMEELAAGPHLTPVERDTALAAAAADRANFAAGYATVAEHGRLSQTGATIIENARVWIEGG